jgi:hypothetical protein
MNARDAMVDAKRRKRFDWGQKPIHWRITTVTRLGIKINEKDAQVLERKRIQLHWGSDYLFKAIKVR